MPLKFLKKCRQYNVTSKNVFVISVHHLLDTAPVDCTITSESLGQECLDNVCQRLLIQQPEFFGLRYRAKGKENEYKWLELDRSLSRQLEKYAANTLIYLRVRHYVTTGVRHLTDEVTRYYYFLQLKSDIYEGKILCDIRTAILLALYYRQAEYDSYQNEKQTKDYLKKSLVLPRNMQGLANDDAMLDRLIAEVLQQHPNIVHLNQSQAEEMYVQCCQQLEGYGEERFQAKDVLGNDLLLGLAINGMIVTADNGRQYFPWKNFQTVTIDKRTIKIEQNKVDGSSILGNFVFSEADAARYFWKLTIAQHKFFKRYIDTDATTLSMLSAGDAISNNAIIMSDGIGSYDYNDKMLMEQQQLAMYASGDISMLGSNSAANGSVIGVGAGRDEFMSAHTLTHGLLTATDSAPQLMSSNMSLATSQQSSSNGGNAGGGGGLHQSQQLTPEQQHMWLNKDYVSAQDYVSSQLLSPHSSTLGQSSSCLDLSNNNLHSSSGGDMISSSSSTNNNHMLVIDAQERERLKAMLPTYRPAPDYETAVQLKYHTPAGELHNFNNLHYQNAAAAAAAAATHAATYYAGSQPDVHNPSAYGEHLSQLAAQRYPDVAQPAAAMHAHHHLGAVTALNQIQQQSALAGKQHASYIDLPQRVHVMRNKAPPAYTASRLSSSSTPDLAVASHRPLLGYRAYVSGSSPDLVSNRNLLNGITKNACANMVAPKTSSGATILHQYPYVGHIGHSQTYLPTHGTFENLNMIEEQPSIMTQLRQSALSQAAAAQAINPSYEQHSPTLPPSGYRGSNSGLSQSQTLQVPPSQPPPPIPHIHNQQSQPAPLQRSAINGSIEPIYENVPLPAQPQPQPSTPLQRNSEQRISNSSAYNRNLTPNSGNNSAELAAMRNRAASVQSAPGLVVPIPAARHHHQQQQQKQQQQQQQTSQMQLQVPAHDESSSNSSSGSNRFGSKMHSERAASTELQFIEPTLPQRTIRAASAAPALSNISPAAAAAALQQQPPRSPVRQTPPPRQNRLNLFKTNSKSVPAVDNNMPPAAHNKSALSNSRHVFTSHDDSLNSQFSVMNLTASSTTSSMHNNTTNSSAMTSMTLNSSNASSNTNTTKEVKRKRRWNILGRSKTPDKQKSATLGREKVNNASATTKLASRSRQTQDDFLLPQHCSTGGMTKSQPISGQYSRDKLCQILNNKLNDTQLFMEFEQIPKRREDASYNDALLEENLDKNADPNFLPYDDNRVRLTASMQNRHGYVNASKITATVGSKQRFYILAQSPHIESTRCIFWQCVWEADVYLIVALTDDVAYMPPTSHQRLEFGQFQVYQEFSQASDRCTTSKLRLYHIPSRRYRSVWHLQYADWAEQNCPRDVNHYLDFLEELNSVRLASTHEVPPGHNTNPPVLMHCLEGSGRSGVTLTADLLLYTLVHNEDLHIPRVIGQLRHQRDNIIPSLAQYKFIYSLLITHLKRSRLI